jgi:hypothetical protein
MDEEYNSNFEYVGYDSNGGFYFQSDLYGEIKVDASQLTKPAGILRISPDCDYWLEQFPARKGKEVDWIRAAAALMNACYIKGSKK